MKLKNYLLILATMAVIFMATAADAEPFAVSVTQGADASTWIYTLYNNDATGDIIPLWLDLEWAESQGPVSYSILGSPEGWEPNYLYGFPSWDAVLTNEPSSGNSLSGFIISADCPALNYTAGYLNLGEIESDSGCVTVSEVPEPGCLLSLFGGLSSIGIFAIRRKS